jgi:hypothetical protein
LKLEVSIEVAQRCSKMFEWVCRCLNRFWRSLGGMGRVCRSSL